MMTVSHMQSVIRRNSTNIQELEEDLRKYRHTFYTCAGRRMMSHPLQRKIAKLAALQVTLKKEMADMLLFDRLYGHESA